MNVRAQVVIGSLGLLSIAACGRAVEDADGRGGVGDTAGVGGQSPVGSGGSGATVIGGKGGATNTGGSSGKGGATDTGGSIVSGGEAGEGGTSGDSVALGESSWDVTLALEVTKAPDNVNVHCTAADFTLHFSPTANGLEAIGGRNGELTPVAEFIRSAQANPTYSYSGSPALPVPMPSTCDMRSLSISELTVWASDADLDGTADSIHGSGKANGSWILGDFGLPVELSFELRGAPDTTKPLLSAPSTLHPLDGINLGATEPIAPSSTVTLVSTGADKASQPLNGYPAGEGAFRAFSSPIILPFGSSWTVSTTGGDLANLPFDVATLPPITVLADPGLFAQDGFESTPLLSLTGGAKVVAAIGSLPAIAANASLFVPAGSSATLHLARPSSANSLSFKAQVLLSSSGSSFSRSNYLDAGVIGGSERVQSTQALPSTPSTATNDATWPFAGPKQDVTLALTESGSDVAIRIAIPSCQGMCPPAYAFLVDDLRIE